MTMKFKAVFNFTKKDELTQFEQSKMINDFCKLRDALVDQTNPLLEKWNKAYKEPMNANEDGIDPAYERYMVDRFKPYVDKVNRSIRGRLSSVKLGLHEEYCDIIAISKKDADQKIELTLEPIY